MKNIYEQLLYTTLRIECFNTDGSLDSIGTGFLLQRPVGEDEYKIYLVSNKHVLDGYNKIVITFTRIKNGMPDIGNKVIIPITELLGKIVCHPNPRVDIAVLECTGLFILMPEQLFFKAVSYDMLATFEEPELSVAQNVNFVGYPDNRFDEVNNIPLIRTGIISSHPCLDYNGDPVFIIDAQVFPGSSGSPVYIDLTYENIKNGELVLGTRNIKLLGVVSSTMIRNNQLQALQTSTIYTTQEVLGLGIVFKSTAIKELIDNMPIDN